MSCLSFAACHICGFWLPLWYLHTFLKTYHKTYTRSIIYLYTTIDKNMFCISIFFYSNKAFERVPLHTWKKKHRIEISLLLGEIKLHKTLNKIWRKKETSSNIDYKYSIHLWHMAFFVVFVLLIVFLSLHIIICMFIYVFEFFALFINTL